MSFKVCVSLLIFCLVDLSIGVSEVLKSPTIIVFLLISPFILISICLTYCGAPMLAAYIFIIVVSSSLAQILKLKFLHSKESSDCMCHTHQTVSIKYAQFLYINYPLTKLLKQSDDSNSTFHFECC